MKILTAIFVALFCQLSAFAQELNVTVTINTESITTTANRSKTIYKNMENAFTEFLNKRRWTKDNFEPEERINVNLVVNITAQPAIGVFTANAQILASRPVYGVDYETVLFNFLDKDFNFNYLENQPMEFNDNAYTNNITSLLSFYAYVVIGLDYDSYKLKGGTRFFEKVQNVVNNAQNSGQSGWKASDGKVTRFWLSENLYSQQLLNFREAYYKYHRLALDNLIKDPKGCQQKVLEVLKVIQKTRRIVPVSVLLNNFFIAKADELVSIFSEGDMPRRQEVVNLLRQLDATRTTKYQKIIKPDSN